MALKKKIPYNNMDLYYWKISGINISYTGKIAQIYVVGFIDEEQRIEGIEKKIAFENYMCKGEQFERYFSNEVLSEAGNNTLILAYEYLKDEIGTFENSTDV